MFCFLKAQSILHLFDFINNSFPIQALPHRIRLCTLYGPFTSMESLVSKYVHTSWLVWSDNLPFADMKSTLVITCTIVTTSVLAPILWYLWIVLGTANANFYFGITIGYNVAQVNLFYLFHASWPIYIFNWKFNSLQFTDISHNWFNVLICQKRVLY